MHDALELRNLIWLRATELAAPDMSGILMDLALLGRLG